MTFLTNGTILSFDPDAISQTLFYDVRPQDFGKMIVLIPDVTQVGWVGDAPGYGYQAAVFTAHIEDVYTTKFGVFYSNRGTTTASYHTALNLNQGFEGVPNVIVNSPSSPGVDFTHREISFSYGSASLSNAQAAPKTGKTYVGIGTDLNQIMDEYRHTSLIDAHGIDSTQITDASILNTVEHKLLELVGKIPGAIDQLARHYDIRADLNETEKLAALSAKMDPVMRVLVKDVPDKFAILDRILTIYDVLESAIDTAKAGGNLAAVANTAGGKFVAAVLSGAAGELAGGVALGLIAAPGIPAIATLAVSLTAAYVASEVVDAGVKYLWHDPFAHMSSQDLAEAAAAQTAAEVGGAPLAPKWTYDPATQQFAWVGEPLTDTQVIAILTANHIGGNPDSGSEVSADFNGDHHSDILWFRDNGTVSIWDSGQISGAHIIANTGAVPSSWHIAGAGDFDGNGHGDVLWRNDSGAVSIWDNGQIGGAHIIANAGVVPNSWHIAGTGDFDGNGLSDILWRNDNGAASIWDNGAIGGAHIIANAGVVPNSWHIAGTGDFDGNGLSDILWRNDNGAVSTWDNGAIGGAHIIANAGVVANAWHISGTGDFDGNGHDDILWRNDNGAVSIWDNGQIAGAHIIANAGVVASSWHIVDTGDYDGNRHSDILWQNDNGAVSIWDNGDIAHAHIIAASGAVPSGWHIA